MNNHFVYQLVQYITNEEESGNALTPDNFSKLLQVSSVELTRQAFRLYEDNQEVTDNLRRFKEDLTIGGFTNGSFPLPSGYYRKSYLRARKDDSSDYVNVNFVTDSEFSDRYGKLLTGPTYRRPIARITSDAIEIVPSDMHSGIFGYLRKPETPFYDYYYNASGRIVFFEAGNHTLTAGEVGRNGETQQVISSVNVDLDWNENEILVIVGMICSKSGVNLKESQVIEYAEIMKQQAT